MKKLLAIITVLFIIACSASAQQTTPAPQAEKRNIKKELNLSKEQANQLKEEKKNFKTESQAIKNNSSLTAEQKKEKFKALRESRQAKMKGILTPEQQNKMEAFKKQRQQGHGKRGGRKHGTPVVR